MKRIAVFFLLVPVLCSQVQHRITTIPSPDDSATGGIFFVEKRANGTNKVGVVAPASIASDVVWTLPDADQVGCMVSDGSGHLAIQPCDGGGTVGVLENNDPLLAKDFGTDGTDGLARPVLARVTNNELFLYNDAVTEGAPNIVFRAGAAGFVETENHFVPRASDAYSLGVLTTDPALRWRFAFLSRGIDITSPTVEANPTLTFGNTAGPAGRKKGSIAFDTAASEGGWVFQQLSDVGAFVKNLVHISQQHPRIGIGTTNPQQTIDASGLGDNLVIAGSSSGSGNIIMLPGNVAGYSSVVVWGPRTDQPGLVVQEHGASASTVSPFIVADGSGNWLFNVLGSGEASPGTVIARSMISRTNNTYDLGASNNIWKRLFVGDVTANSVTMSGGTIAGNIAVTGAGTWSIGSASTYLYAVNSSFVNALGGVYPFNANSAEVGATNKRFQRGNFQTLDASLGLIVAGQTVIDSNRNMGNLGSIGGTSLWISGTEVIDSSRNLKNVAFNNPTLTGATIGGNVDVNGGGVYSIGNSTGYLYAVNASFYNTAGGVYPFSSGQGEVGSSAKRFQRGNFQTLDASLGLVIAGQTVIDSNRNMGNLGAIGGTSLWMNGQQVVDTSRNITGSTITATNNLLATLGIFAGYDLQWGAHLRGPWTSDTSSTWALKGKIAFYDSNNVFRGWIPLMNWPSP